MPENKKPPRTESPSPLQLLGREGERLAAEYLEKKGYRVVASRFRLFRGEIDLIAWDGDTLVFVEVKARASDDFGLPEESVTPAKQRQVKRIALGYVVENGLEDVNCRFDVIAIEKNEEGGGPEIVHFVDAF